MPFHLQYTYNYLTNLDAGSVDTHYTDLKSIK